MMRAKIITGGFGAALLLTLLLAPAAMAQDTAEQPAAVTVEPGLLERLGVDNKPSAELSVEELQARIAKLTAALKQAELKHDAKKQLRAQLKADRKELEQRQAAAAAQPAESAAEQPASTEKPAATQAGETAAEQPAAPAELPTTQGAEQPAATADQPAQPTDDQTQAPAESTANAPTAPAPAAKQAPSMTAEQPAASAAPEQPAAATDAAPTQPEAPASVEAPPKVSAAAEEQAAALLADKTPAESLTDEALKARVEQYRELLDAPELSRKTAKALRQRLKTDRQALRARVAAREAAETAARQQAPAAIQQQPQELQQAQPAQTQQEQAQQQQAQQQPPQDQPKTKQEQTQQATTPDAQSKKTEPQATAAQPAVTAAPQNAPLEIAPLLPMVIAPTSQEIPLILEDRRPAQALADGELNRRILAYREALQDEDDYSQDELTLFDRQLREDRLELNDRLLVNRNQRATVYEEWTNPNIDINTEPELGEPQAPNSIFAAEVDDEEMWDQLVAAPLEPIKRRYSRHDVVEEPELVMNLPEVREAMPSIELDTITFGFNEAFVREEEIFDLDRIARMIERVVAAHPDEIFMIEGHTDAVGSDAYNLKLSRQRAQAVKAALNRYYVIAPENLATVGLGERYLKIWTPEAEEENRRVTVRRVTPLVQGYEGAE